MFRKFVMMFAAAALVTGAADVAGATTTLKIGTVAPQDSSWGKEFKKFAQDVSDDTNGELVLDFQWNGQAGDEDLMVQKIRSGQLDAAAVTALGLAHTGVTDIMAFEIPGLFTSWAKIDAARDAMKDELSHQFESKGFTVLGWGDVGASKNMSVGFEIHHPTDLQGKGVFYFRGDPISPRLFAAIGGITPKELSINEVLPTLTGGGINVITAPPIGAEQLQWSTRITHINSETLFFAIGGVIASSARLASLPPKFRDVITHRGAESAARLTDRIRHVDAEAYERMKKTKHVYGASDAEREEWRQVFIKVAKELRGNVISPAFFDRVVALAGNPLAQ